jgi:hypothetical protein
MPLDQQQREALERAARENGVDPADLIKAAEEEIAGAEPKSDGKPDAKGASGEQSAGVEPPKLFQYHLPFVRVREVRKVWLKLDEPFPGDDEIAAEWAAKFESAPPAADAQTSVE